jgi:hypothetical protein
MSKPHSNNAPEVTTYFQVQRNRDSVSEAGEAKPGDVPKLPASSPWSGENVLPDELPIDRSEDSDQMGIPIDQLNR